jgi:cbb3-type cytochrome oxidase maturation protein
MDVIYIVLPLAIGLAGVALGAFYWAVRRGQFDDLDTPPCRVLFEDSAAGEDPVKPAGPR